ncbi:hypothetical protein BaRGS_00007559 [Batillaria attramentaria]|uniref:Ribosome biogenesis protein BRX1 homolog n=1 Tax=Batillaria attramentaria TaxID=370345 RepID=A0ABD0LNP0_9CAEN
MAKRKHVLESTGTEQKAKKKKLDNGEKKENAQPAKWTNKQRVLVFSSRGIAFRSRHLMQDLKRLMPHSKAESKMDRKDKLFVINEICEMKNCTKCIYFECKKKQDLYMWISNVPRGPSAKFLVENVHTMLELKMTGNCLKGSRPILSFDQTFDDTPHHKLLKELFTQVFNTPNHHPRSQPFFDRVMTFSIHDHRIFVRNFQILEEDGSLAEIGPRFVLNLIRMFEGSFGGPTLYQNPHYISPNQHRRNLRRAVSMKYKNRVAVKKAQELKKPDVSYKTDPLDDVFTSNAKPAPKTSNLSVNAPEFVPKGYSTQAGSLQAHPPHQAEGFVEAFGQMRVGGAEDLTNYLLLEFQKTMQILMTQPGNIPEYLRPLCEKLQQAGTPEVLSQVVDILYQQSVFEPNFRYTGARVCHFLCNHLKDHPIFGTFKATFLQKCQQDFMNRQQLLARGNEGLETLCGLTLFMGELFLNVTVDQGGQTERLEFLPRALTELMITLVSHPTDMSVKTVCQLLKLAGGPTEEKMNQDPQNAQYFSQVFAALTALKGSPQLAPNMKALIESVLKFREENWGQSPQPVQQSSPAQNRQMLDYAQGIQAEPVFFNMHGKQITREEAGYSDDGDLEDGHYVLTEDEEREFLAWQAETTAYGGQMTEEHLPSQSNHMGYDMSSGYRAWSTDDGYSDYQASYGDEYGGDDGYAPYLPDGLTMDEEAEKAYEDFLNSQCGASSRK